VVRSNSCKGPVYPGKGPKKSQKAKRKFWGQQVLFSTKFLKFGPERANLAILIAGQFSRGKETREQEFYYKTMALLILINKRLGQSLSRKSWCSTKCKALLSLECFLHLCLFDRSQKGAHFYQRDAILTGRHRRLEGGVAPNCPPWIRHWLHTWVKLCSPCFHLASTPLTWSARSRGQQASFDIYDYPVSFSGWILARPRTILRFLMGIVVVMHASKHIVGTELEFIAAS